MGLDRISDGAVGVVDASLTEDFAIRRSGGFMLRWSVACFTLLSVTSLLGEAPPQRGGGGAGARGGPPSASAPAQGLSTDQAEDQAQRLVVMIDGKFGDESSIGAGIIFDRRPDSLYIVTANHVVRRGTTEAGAIGVRLVMLPGARLPAKLLEPFTDRDLAVLRVDGVSAFERDLAPLRLDRLGDLEAVKVRDEVYTIGQPNGRRWDVSAGGDRITRVDEGFAFQSSGVAPGSSGGALFNAQWLLIGLVQKDAPPSAEAIRADVVMRVLRAEKYSVVWQRPIDGGTRTADTTAVTSPRARGVLVPPAEPVAGGRVAIVNANSGLCLTIAGGGTDNNAEVVQYLCDDHPSRFWNFIAVEGTDIFQIKNVNSGLCLTVAGGATDRNVTSVQYPCDSHPSRRWRYVKSEDRTFRLMNVNSGLCLTIAGGGTDRNARAVQFPCDGDRSRDWQFRAAR
jgi:cytolethal distending toxin subunit A